MSDDCYHCATASTATVGSFGLSLTLHYTKNISSASLETLHDVADTRRSKDVRQFYTQSRTSLVAAKHILDRTNVIPSELVRLQETFSS